MLRVSIVFNKSQQSVFPSGTFEALEKEIDRKLRQQYQDMDVRIVWGSDVAMSVSGGKNDKDNKKVKEILEDIWTDGSWIPEMEGVSDGSSEEYFDK